MEETENIFECVCHEANTITSIACRVNREALLTIDNKGILHYSENSTCNTASLLDTCNNNNENNHYNLAFSPKGTKFVVGGTNKKLILFSTFELKFDKILQKVDDTINYLDFCTNGLFLIFSTNSDIILIDMCQSNESIKINGEQKLVKMVKFIPNGQNGNIEQFASVGTDNSIKIWSFSSSDYKSGVSELHRVEELILPDPLKNDFFFISWNSKGSLFCICGKNQILILKKDSWKPYLKLKGENYSNDITAFDWCYDNNFIALGSDKNNVFVIDLCTKKAIFSLELESGIKFLKWKNRNVLSVCLDNGKIIHFNIFSTIPVYILKNQPETDITKVADKLLDKQKQKILFNKKKIENNGKTPMIPNKNSKIKKILSSDEESEKTETIDHSSDFLDSSDGFYFKKNKRKQSKKTLQQPKYSKDKRQKETSFENISTEISKPEAKTSVDANKNSFSYLRIPSFHPGKTPFVTDRQFLCWNLVGSVTQIKSSDEFVVDIVFADISMFAQENIVSERAFDLACLSENAVFLAAKAIKIEEKVQKSAFLRFRSFNRSAEWSLVLDETEDIVSIALEDEEVVVGTSKNLLRIFSFSGLQKNVLVAPGPIVALAAIQRKIAVSYQKDSYSLGLKIFDFLKNLCFDSFLPVIEKNRIIWFGFNDHHVLFTVDSEMNVFCFSNISFKNEWHYLENLSLNADWKADFWLWPVGICTDKVIGVFLPKNEFPAVIPKPSVSTFQLKASILSLSDSNETKSFEEQISRSNLFFHCARAFNDSVGFSDDFNLRARDYRATIDKNIYSAFFHLVDKNEEKAIDLLQYINTPKALTLCLDMAKSKRKTELCSKINALFSKKFPQL